MESHSREETARSNSSVPCFSPVKVVLEASNSLKGAEVVVKLSSIFPGGEPLCSPCQHHLSLAAAYLARGEVHRELQDRRKWERKGFQSRQVVSCVGRDTKQQGGDSPPPQGREDGAGEKTRGGVEPPQPKIIPSLGMERNDLLAAHCPRFNLCSPSKLRGTTEAASEARSQRSCSVCCRGESRAAIGPERGSPALLQQPLSGRRDALSNPGYPERRPLPCRIRTRACSPRPTASSREAGCVSSPQKPVLLKAGRLSGSRAAWRGELRAGHPAALLQHAGPSGCHSPPHAAGRGTGGAARPGRS